MTEQKAKEEPRISRTAAKPLASPSCVAKFGDAEGRALSRRVCGALPSLTCFLHAVRALPTFFGLPDSYVLSIPTTSQQATE